MLTLNGEVLNVYETPKGVNRDTGESYGGKSRVQILATAQLRNGEARREMVDLTVDDPAPFKKLQGRSVRVPVGAFVAGNTVRYFHVKASTEVEEAKQ